MGRRSSVKTAGYSTRASQRRPINRFREGGKSIQPKGSPGTRCSRPAQPARDAGEHRGHRRRCYQSAALPVMGHDSEPQPAAARNVEQQDAEQEGNADVPHRQRGGAQRNEAFALVAREVAGTQRQLQTGEE